MKQNKVIGVKNQGIQLFYDDLLEKGIEYKHHNHFYFLLNSLLPLPLKLKNSKVRGKYIQLKL